MYKKVMKNPLGCQANGKKQKTNCISIQMLK